MTELSNTTTARGSGTYDDPYIVDGRIKTADSEGNEIHLAIRAPAPLTDDPSIDRSDVSASAKLAHQIHQAQQGTAAEVETLGQTVSSMNGVVDGISEAVSSLSGTVSSLSTSVSELSGSVQDITDKIESGEIGGGGSGTSDGSNPNVLAPAIISPAAGAENVPLYCTLSAGPYRNAFVDDVRSYRVFQVTTVADTDWESATELTAAADSINLNAPLTPETAHKWRCRDVSSYGLMSAWSEVTVFTTGPAIAVNAPELTVDKAPSSVLENPLYTGSAFELNQSGVTPQHDYTVWTLYAVTDGERGAQLWTSGNDGVNLTSIRQPKGYLTESGTFEIAVRYHDAVYGFSPETAVRFTCADQFVYVETPVLSCSGAPSDVPQCPVLSGSAFYVANGEGGETHTATSWFVRLKSTGETVFSSEHDTSHLTSWQTPALTKNTEYIMSCIYECDGVGASEEAILEVKTMEEFEGDSGTPDMTGFAQGPCPRQDRLDRLNLTPLQSCDERGSANWGLYQNLDGSVMAYIIPFWLYVGPAPEGSPYEALGESYADAKPYYAYPDEETAAADGYFLMPGFKNNGKIQGFFMSPYQAAKSGSKLVGKKSTQPCTEANYQLFQYARNVGEGYMCISVQQFAVLTMISYLVGIHGSPAWKDPQGALGSKNYPKGNNNSGRDTDDTAVTNSKSSSPLTGTCTPYAKTTHNGEECGIADVNGSYWDWCEGMTAPSDGAGQCWIIKPEVDITSLTFGTGNAATDAFGTTTHIQTLYSKVETSLIETSGRWGGGSRSPLFKASEAGKEMCGILPAKGGTSSAGTNLYGCDNIWSGLPANCVPLCGGCWSNGTLAGVFARYLGHDRGNSNSYCASRLAAYGE